MAQQSADSYAFPPVIELLSIDSTNNYALNLLRQHNLTERQEFARHGTAVFAHEQFAGKGQRGKTWLSNKEENIHLSIIIEPEPVALQQQFVLIAIIAVSVRNFFESYAQSEIYIKWPNDIYFKDRKAGGILIENIITGDEWKWAVAGIGLNINQTQFGTEGLKAVSLKQITGKSFNCFELAKELRNLILLKYRNFNEADVIAEYNRFLYKRTEPVLLEKDGRRFEALVKEVLPSGQLVVETDGELHLDFGGVKWIV